MSVGPCGRCQSPIETGDLRCAVCGLTVPDRARSAQEVVASILRCDGCGAAVRYEIEAKAPRCAFCSAVMHVETPADPLEEAEGYLPFRVSADDARAALRRWLGTLGMFRPGDLKAAATVESLTPLFWVGWMFDVDALVSWTADSEVGSGRARWAPHSGQSPLSLRNVLVGRVARPLGGGVSNARPALRDR